MEDADDSYYVLEIPGLSISCARATSLYRGAVCRRAEVG
jgi:hypothetical protein